MHTRMYRFFSAVAYSAEVFFGELAGIFDLSNLWNKQTSLRFNLSNLWNKQSSLRFDLSNLWNK